MASKNVVELTVDNWMREVVQSNQPVLVDFWGPGCPPCAKLSPVIDSLAEQYAGRVKVGKVNVQENYELASEFDVNSIPRVMIFKGGKKPLHHLTGLTSEGVLSKLLNDLLRK